MTDWYKWASGHLPHHYTTSYHCQPGLLGHKAARVIGLILLTSYSDPTIGCLRRNLDIHHVFEVCAHCGLRFLILAAFVCVFAN